jgi:YidC/Oxa1 family membrane protein insertase
MTNNLWTLGQQYFVLRRMPPPGSDAAKAKAEAEKPKVDPKTLAPKPGQKPTRAKGPKAATLAPESTVSAAGASGGATDGGGPDTTATPGETTPGKSTPAKATPAKAANARAGGAKAGTPRAGAPGTGSPPATPAGKGGSTAPPRAKRKRR